MPYNGPDFNYGVQQNNTTMQYILIQIIRNIIKQMFFFFQSICSRISNNLIHVHTDFKPNPGEFQKKMKIIDNEYLMTISLSNSD